MVVIVKYCAHNVLIILIHTLTQRSTDNMTMYIFTVNIHCNSPNFQYIHVSASKFSCEIPAMYVLIKNIAQNHKILTPCNNDCRLYKFMYMYYKLFDVRHNGVRSGSRVLSITTILKRRSNLENGW